MIILVDGETSVIMVKLCIGYLNFSEEKISLNFDFNLARCIKKYQNNSS